MFVNLKKYILNYILNPMNRIMKYLFFLLVTVTISFGGEVDFLNQYLDGKVDVDYPYQKTHSSEYYIFAAQEDTPKQLLSLLDDSSGKKDWPKILMVLGSLSVGYDVPLVPMINATEVLESSPELNDTERLSYLEKAYWALARQGSKESLEFLKQRTQKDFWEGRTLPTYTVTVLHSDNPPRAATARSQAILAIGKHPLEAAELYLKKLYKDPEFHQDAILREELEAQFRMRSSWMRLHQKRLRAFEVKKEMDGKDGNPIVKVAEEPTVEIPATPPAPEVEEVAQEFTAPEPAIEKPAEVVTSEPSEEPVEQSSQWWLWLIGLLVALGGLGLVLRRKN